jgi:hypothetical protein
MVIRSENHKQTHALKTQSHVRHSQLVRRALWFDSRIIRRLLIGSPGDWYEPSTTHAVRCPTAQLVDGTIEVRKANLPPTLESYHLVLTWALHQG